ncbi:MAG: hypothetical protein SAJ37_01620 [Oscillatoria sp. PMC 1068.18]|nr:hypothetical protein [Oscillatoria sp. PMC 1076.18]MEC4987421.1 hypothetical protein [Oscillatoria sp. PMC 1068.18]
MEYLITPTASTSWKINLVDFTQSLQQQWSDVKIRTVTNSDDYYALEWVILKGERLDGALHRDGQGVSLDRSLKICASFAIWFRSLVPETQNLLFYDQGFNFQINLNLKTTKSEIIQLVSLVDNSSLKI